MLHLINKKDINLIKEYKSVLNSLNTSTPIYYVESNLDGSVKYNFIINFINVMDKVFVSGDYNNATEKQIEFIMRYCDEANLDVLVSEDLKQLDVYLGSYVGEEDLHYVEKIIRSNNGVYNEYSTK